METRAADAYCVYAQPANGITDSEHFLFRAEGAAYIGEPTELNESDRVEWIPLPIFVA